MTGLITSELRKVRTTQTVYWLFGITLLLVAGLTALGAWQFTRTAVPAARQGIDPGWAEGFRQVIAGVASSGGHVMLLILGVLLITAEFRHNTITPTFLAAPRRWQVIVAKFATVTVVSLVFAVGMLLAAVIAALPYFRSALDELELGSGDLWLTVFGNVLVLVLFGLLGLGIGALLRNQVAAVVVSIVYFLVIENILTGLAFAFSWFRTVYRFLPGVAATGLQRVVLPPEAESLQPLAMWAGGLVLARVCAAVLRARVALRPFTRRHLRPSPAPPRRPWSSAPAPTPRPGPPARARRG